MFGARLPWRARRESWESRGKRRGTCAAVVVVVVASHSSLSQRVESFEARLDMSTRSERLSNARSTNDAQRIARAASTPSTLSRSPSPLPPRSNHTRTRRREIWSSVVRAQSRPFRSVPTRARRSSCRFPSCCMLPSSYSPVEEAILMIVVGLGYTLGDDEVGLYHPGDAGLSRDYWRRYFSTNSEISQMPFQHVVVASRDFCRLCIVDYA